MASPGRQRPGLWRTALRVERERLARAFRRVLPNRPGPGRRPDASARSEKTAARQRSGPEPHPREAPRPLVPRTRVPAATSPRVRRRSATALVVSAVLHSLLVAALFLASPRPTGSIKPTEQTFTIRWSRPQPPRPAPPEKPEKKTPPPRRPPAPEEGTPSPEALATASEPTPREPAAPPTLRPTFLTPPPIGVGTSVSGRGGSASGLRGRLARKGRALARFGGDGTDEAVSLGLLWLARHQNRDGSWRARDFRRHCGQHVPCAGKGLAEFDVGVSALATLAFLGAGHLPSAGANAEDRGPFGGTVRRALQFLGRSQMPDGAIGRTGDHYNYNHALATLALLEAQALTENERYSRQARRAMAFTTASQQGRGGWDYVAEKTGRNDLSVSGWQLMALAIARATGVDVPRRTHQRAVQYATHALTEDGEGIYANRGAERDRRGVNMSAVGLLAQLFTRPTAAAAHRGPRLRRAAARLLGAPPDWDATRRWESTFQSYYYWYTATLALFHLGGKEWEAWNFFLKRTLLPLQSARSHARGSWPPEDSWIGQSGGRVYSTAIAVLTLETYYRYEPLHAQRSTKGSPP